MKVRLRSSAKNLPHRSKEKKIEKDRVTVCFREDVDDLLNNLPTELDKYVINKEIQYTGNFLFFVSLSTIKF